MQNKINNSIIIQQQYLQNFNFLSFGLKRDKMINFSTEKHSKDFSNSMNLLWTLYEIIVMNKREKIYFIFFLFSFFSFLFSALLISLGICPDACAHRFKFVCFLRNIKFIRIIRTSSSWLKVQQAKKKE